MISSKVFAREVAELLLDVSGKLDESVARAEQACPDIEFQAYRRAIAEVLGDVWDEVLKPLYDAHPDLKPSWLE